MKKLLLLSVLIFSVFAVSRATQPHTHIKVHVTSVPACLANATGTVLYTFVEEESVQNYTEPCNAVGIWAYCFDFKEPGTTATYYATVRIKSPKNADGSYVVGTARGSVHVDGYGVFRIYLDANDFRLVYYAGLEAEKH